MHTLRLLALTITLGTSSPAANLATLHAFTGGTDGCNPAAPLISTNRALYGTTTHGGNTACVSGCGAVFELTPPVPPRAGWQESVLYVFDPQVGDGVYPYGGLLAGPSGELYGTTSTAGSNSFNFGTVFELVPPASPGAAWTERVIYDFCSLPSCADGAEPVAGLTMGGDGLLYGTTEAGGPPVGCIGPGGGCGTVFQLTPPAIPGGAWTESVLYGFQAQPDGAVPTAGVAIGPNGELYGTTFQGGQQNNYGTVFQLTPPMSPGGAWTESVLYTFQDGSDGANPRGPVIVNGSGALFGAADGGGSGCGIGCGTVFELTPPASSDAAWTYTVVYMLEGKGGPLGGVVFGKNGVLYGATSQPFGALFELTPGSPWVETELAQLGRGHGSDPAAPLLFESSTGALFGTAFTSTPDKLGCGTVFEWRP